MKSKKQIKKGDKVIITKIVNNGHYLEIGEIFTCVEVYDALYWDSFINEKGDLFSLIPEEWEYYEEQQVADFIDRNELAKEFLNSMLKGGRNYNTSMMVGDVFDLADKFIKQAKLKN